MDRAVASSRAGAGGGRRGGRAGQARRGASTPPRLPSGAVSAEPRRSSSSPRPAAGPVRARDDRARRRPVARRRPRLGLRRPRDLRPLPGRASARASSRSTAIPRRPSTCTRSRHRDDVPRPDTGSPPGRRLGCPAQVRRRRRGRRAAGQPGAPPGRAQGGRRARRSRSTRSCGCTTSRCASPTCATRPATWSGCSRRSSASGGSPGSRATTYVLAGLQRGAPRGELGRDGRGPRRRDDRRRVAGVPRPGARGRVRRRLDDAWRVTCATSRAARCSRERAR